MRSKTATATAADLLTPRPRSSPDSAFATAAEALPEDLDELLVRLTMNHARAATADR